jgi:hypothetical protein
LAAFGLALSLVSSLVVVTEVLLAAKGYKPTVVDSKELWIAERQRASRLGGQALILVGASRIQLGMDLDVLREETGLEPIQLAIDGTSFLPILDGLASDPSVTGTVVVDFAEGVVGGPSDSSRAIEYQTAFERLPKPSSWNYLQVEKSLTQAVRRRLRAYADGGRPLDAWLFRLLDTRASPQYLITLPDRSRLADYTRVHKPGFYLIRVGRELGADIPADPRIDWKALEQELTRAVRHLRPADESVYRSRAQEVERAVRTIQARGGHVILLRMPTSGLVLEADRRRWPRNRFWNHVAASSQARTIYFEDWPGLNSFTCPDGSHLDYRDRAAFTKAFAAAAGFTTRSRRESVSASARPPQTRAWRKTSARSFSQAIQYLTPKPPTSSGSVFHVPRWPRHPAPQPKRSFASIGQAAAFGAPAAFTRRSPRWRLGVRIYRREPA